MTKETILESLLRIKASSGGSDDSFLHSPIPELLSKREGHFCSLNPLKNLYSRLFCLFAYLLSLFKSALKEHFETEKTLDGQLYLITL
jgi:hypothetical protein